LHARQRPLELLLVRFDLFLGAVIGKHTPDAFLALRPEALVHLRYGLLHTLIQRWHGGYSSLWRMATGKLTLLDQRPIL
jgi:hypothetical protein